MIQVRANSQNKNYFKDRSQIMESNRAPEWLSLNLMNLSGSIQTEPDREDIEIPLNEQLIVKCTCR